MKMKIPTASEYEKETIKGALEGDATDGLEALILCRDALSNEGLSSELRVYIVGRLSDVIEGDMPLTRALCIEKSSGRPKNALPKWQEELGAFAAILANNGMKAEEINAHMDSARQRIEGPTKGVDRKTANQIRKEWAPMRKLKESHLEKLAEDYVSILREILGN